MLAVLRTARRLAPAAARGASRRRMTAPAASEKVEKICDDVCQLNVLELKEFLDLFKELCEVSGISVLLVTHDPNLAKRADRMLLLKDGVTAASNIREAWGIEEE